MKQLTSDKIPPLHTRVLLPLQISGDKDPELEVSEGTVTTIFVQYQIKVLILMNCIHRNLPKDVCPSCTMKSVGSLVQLHT